jgi:hypothetical protein
MELPNQREKTVIQMYQYLRDVCTTKLLNTPIHLGSQDVVKVNLLLWWIKLEEIKHGCCVYKSLGEVTRGERNEQLKCVQGTVQLVY